MVKNRQHLTFPLSGSNRTSISNVGGFYENRLGFLLTQNQHHSLERGSYSKGMVQNITPTWGRQREAARLSI